MKKSKSRSTKRMRPKTSSCLMYGTALCSALPPLTTHPSVCSHPLCGMCDVCDGQVFLVTSKLSKCCRDEFIPTFHQMLFPVWAPLLAENKSNGQRTAAMCVMDDVIQYCGKPALIYVEKFYPIVLRDCKHSDVDIRQSAVFGIGACAAAAGAPFAPAIPCMHATLPCLCALGSFLSPPPPPSVRVQPLTLCFVVRSGFGCSDGSDR
jgi:hypothetical protein